MGIREDRRASRMFRVAPLWAALLCGALIPWATAQEPLPLAQPGVPARTGSEQLNAVEIRELPLREALRLFSLETGINVVASAQAATLRVLQETSDISADPAQVLVPTNTGFVQQNVDVVESRTVSGTVVAKDGLTVAFGGLIKERARDTRAEVPVVGKLPVVSFFFRRQNSGRERTELVVMIRPYVFNTPAESACLSQQLIDVLSLLEKSRARFQADQDLESVAQSLWNEARYFEQVKDKERSARAARVQGDAVLAKFNASCLNAHRAAKLF